MIRSFASGQKPRVTGAVQRSIQALEHRRQGGLKDFARNGVPPGGASRPLGRRRGRARIARPRRVRTNGDRLCARRAGGWSTENCEGPVRLSIPGEGPFGQSGEINAKGRVPAWELTLCFPGPPRYHEPHGRGCDAARSPAGKGTGHCGTARGCSCLLANEFHRTR